MGTKYKEVYMAIEKDILDGHYNETRKLNTEDVYIAQYNVSRNTVRNAIDLLIKRGHCFPIQGSGVFLRRKRPAFSFDLENIYGLTNNVSPLPVTSEILKFSEVTASEEIAHKMDVAPGSPLYYVERMRYVDKKPYIYEYNYFNKALMPDFDVNTAEGSIFTYLSENRKLPVSFMDMVIQAVQINSDVAAKFQLIEGDPGLQIDGFTLVRTGEVIQFFKSICHYENVRLLKLASYF